MSRRLYIETAQTYILSFVHVFGVSEVLGAAGPAEVLWEGVLAGLKETSEVLYKVVLAGAAGPEEFLRIGCLSGKAGQWRSCVYGFWHG